MAKKTNKQPSNLSDEYIELIRVKPEDTEKRLESIPYTIIPRPENEKPPRGTMWCPYEGKWSKFSTNNSIFPSSSYSRCKSCGISVEDFYVKQENKLWGDIKTKRREV